MNVFLKAFGTSLCAIGFFCFFTGAMAVESMPTPMMLKVFSACFVAMFGGIACLYLVGEE